MARPTLIRIPWSHFCKKAEWGLTQAGIPYDTWDLGVKGMQQLDRLSAEATVPVLLVDGRLIEGSDQILTWAAENAREGTPPLYPEALRGQVQEWEVWGNEAVGPVARREAYRVAYATPNRLTKNPLVHVALRMGRPVVLGILKFYRTRRFDAHDAEAIPKIIANVADELARQGSGYLVGSAPTAADHGVAPLLEPLIYAAAGHRYTAEPGWQALVAYVERVKPRRLTRRRRRAMTERRFKIIEAARASEEGREEEALPA